MYANIREFRSALSSIPVFQRAEDLRISNDIQQMIRDVLKTEIELDAILLLVNHLFYLHDDPEIWKFYQSIIEQSCSKIDSNYIIAMAAAHQKNSKLAIVKYNVTRLVYFCIGELLTHSFVGHSNLRVGCINILIRVEQYKEAAWLLRELRYLLSFEDELAREFSYIENNRKILESLASDAPTARLRMLASHILQIAGL